MKNFKFTSVIDYIFINFLIFLITFTWARFITKNFALSIVIGTTFTFIFIIFTTFVLKRKKNKIKISKSLQKDIDNYNLTLLSNSKLQNLNFFANALSNQNNLKILEKENLIICDTSCLCPMYGNQVLSVDNAVKQIRLAIANNLTKITFFCFEIDDKTKIFLQQINNIEVEIINKNNIYSNFFIIYQTYPQIIFETKTQKKLKFKQIINLSFCKSRSKNYFLSGLFILFCSFFVRLNFYYVFFSSLLFTFSLISLTRKTN